MNGSTERYESWGDGGTNGDPKHSAAPDNHHEDYSASSSQSMASHPDSDADDEKSPSSKPRGKPEAMAKRLAAAAQWQAKQALLKDNSAYEQRHEEEVEAEVDDEEEAEDHDADEDSDNPDGEVEAELVVVAEPLSEQMDTEDAVEAEAVAVPDEDGGMMVKHTAKPSAVTNSKSNRKLPVAAKPKYKAKSSSSTRSKSNLLLKEPVPPITESEYDNLDALMVQFCRVPLLAEFSRPVSLLHPELMSAYSKIVKHPVDLGHVCRGIRKRLYKNSRDIRLDVWRVFANCVKFHSHPNNKEAVPSFVSIALHLREFFNNLWQEYMLPSDLPNNASKVIRDEFAKRQKERKKNLENSGVLVLNEKITKRMSNLLGKLVDAGGCVDRLDKEAIFGPDSSSEKDPELRTVLSNLQNFRDKLLSLAESKEEYTVEVFHQELQGCYTKDVLEENPALRNQIANRLNRLVWKLLIPLHEANSRGVTQSSIWGNIAATIWARESSKKPYWPALCLGILPPEDQREGWHDAVTERNEARLPEKLRFQLEVAKKKCIAAQKRQSLSYFLVEFLGTHEFIWVRETDIVENFDPNNDPNKQASSASKKKRTSRSGGTGVVGTMVYATALEECVWASDEYESVLQDALAYSSDNEEKQEDSDEVNYSYSLLSQSDDEADREDRLGYNFKDAELSMSDVDETNWLLTHNGLLDTSSTGRKNAKKRAQDLKKMASLVKKPEVKSEAPKKKKEIKEKPKESKGKDVKAPDAKVTVRDENREKRELEKRRKRRMKDREKFLNNEQRKNKKLRTTSVDPNDVDLTHDKVARASAIVRAYLTRMASNEEYRSLALSGVMTLPTAMIDSTGLLGIALAFRAAVGEIPMPDDGEQQIAKMKPWMAIDTKKPKTVAERVEALERQAALLEKHIEQVRENAKRRKELTDESISARLQLEATIESDDKKARHNPFKTRKKTSSPKVGNQSKSGKMSDDVRSTGDDSAELDVDESGKNDVDASKNEGANGASSLQSEQDDGVEFTNASVVATEAD